MRFQQYHFLYVRKLSDNSAPIEVKILDFQAYDYESFALDLAFFIAFNARHNELNTNFKSFVEYYHLEFVKVMQYVNCPLEDYTYDK